MAKLPKVLETELDDFAREIRRIHEIAKTGTEEEIRSLLVSVPERITELEQEYDRDFDSSFNDKRRMRLNIKYYYLGMTALRAGLSRINMRRKANIKPRQQMMQLTPETLQILMKSLGAIKNVNGNSTKINEIITSSNQLIDPSRVIDTGDPKADEALNKLKSRFQASQASGENKTWLEIVKDIKEEENAKNSVENLFVRNEDGEVEL